MNIPAENHSFDKEAIYHQELRPLINAMRTICQQHHMPMLTCIVFKCEDNEDDITFSNALAGTSGQGGWIPPELLVASAVLFNHIKPVRPEDFDHLVQAAKEMRGCAGGVGHSDN